MNWEEVKQFLRQSEGKSFEEVFKPFEEGLKLPIEMMEGYQK
jgi:hypothetical protein